MKRPFKIKEVRPNIFLFEFTNYYDMCMYFLRYQEFYESPSPKFRGKSFEIFDFMKWYSLKYGKGGFTYPKDWDGFNIPGNIISDVWSKHFIPDKNNYDYVMYEAWKECNAIADGKKFYIIGVTKKGNKALNHEIAHALYYLVPEYKNEMKKLVSELEPAIKSTMFATLKKLGYTPKVYTDEIQAYLATGLTESMADGKRWAEERKPFREVFNKFSRKNK